MGFLPKRLWPLLCCLIALGSSSSILTVQAEPEPQLVTRGVVWQFDPAPPTALIPAQLGYRQSMPLVVTGGVPAVVAFFGRTGDLRSGPANQFEYGITALEYQIQVVGAAGLAYREEWRVDGQRKPQLDSQGTIPASPATLTNMLLFSTGAPLPRGTYQLRFFVGGFIAAEHDLLVR